MKAGLARFDGDGAEFVELLHFRRREGAIVVATGPRAVKFSTTSNCRYFQISSLLLI